jgi:hypothetical protein
MRRQDLRSRWCGGAFRTLDTKQRVPAGHVEPAHTHRRWHSILVTKARM